MARTRKPEATKTQKIQALADRPGTYGERVAAQAAIARIRPIAPAWGGNITDATVRKLEPPATGNRLFYDSEIKGFAVRVTASGARSFVFNYRRRSDGRERRKTIGAYPAWSAAAARDEAKDLRHRVDKGADPLGDLEAERGAPTISDLCDRFLEEYLPGKRPATQRDYRAMIEKEIRPALGRSKVANVTPDDVDKLHRAITKGTRTGRPAPYAANRTAALLSRMFTFAMRKGLRPDQTNPARGVERNEEQRRNRYLSPDEMARLKRALASFPDQDAANIVWLLLLTGARKGEVLSARWDQFDLGDKRNKNGRWTKPAATTKSKKEHRIPISPEARQLIFKLRERAEKEAKTQNREIFPYLFPNRLRSKRQTEHRVEIKSAWAAICKHAKLQGVRLHDLRHTYASVLVSGGDSLPTIGALLGHTQTQTTMRYAHLFDDVLRKATDRVGAAVTNAGKPKRGKVIALR